jgi:hypothetical protein
LVLEHPVTASQKCIWFTRLFAPKVIFAMAISQFEATEKLTGLAIGASYVKSLFSALYEHVKDVAICTDQTERLQQIVTRPPKATAAAKESKGFIGKDGKKHSFLIPPEDYKKMTPAERTAALIKACIAQGLPPKHTYGARTANRSQCSTTPTTTAPSSDTTMVTYAKVANPNSTTSVVSGIAQQTGAMMQSVLRAQRPLIKMLPWYSLQLL